MRGPFSILSLLGISCAYAESVALYKGLSRCAHGDDCQQVLLDNQPAKICARYLEEDTETLQLTRRANVCVASSHCTEGLPEMSGLPGRIICPRALGTGEMRDQTLMWVVAVAIALVLIFCLWWVYRREKYPRLVKPTRGDPNLPAVAATDPQVVTDRPLQNGSSGEKAVEAGKARQQSSKKSTKKRVDSIRCTSADFSCQQSPEEKIKKKDSLDAFDLIADLCIFDLQNKEIEKGEDPKSAASESSAALEATKDLEAQRGLPTGVTPDIPQTNAPSQAQSSSSESNYNNDQSIEPISDYLDGGSSLQGSYASKPSDSAASENPANQASCRTNKKESSPEGEAEAARSPPSRTPAAADIENGQ